MSQASRPVPRDELIAYFVAADVMLVTPLRDGMNLVAKEYVACRSDLGGALVLRDREHRAQAEAHNRELGCSRRGGELDRLDKLALRPTAVVGEQERDASCEDRGRPPGVAGRVHGFAG